MQNECLTLKTLTLMITIRKANKQTLATWVEMKTNIASKYVCLYLSQTRLEESYSA